MLDDTRKEINEKIMRDISAEREQQDMMWGVQDLNPELWAVILGEEVGEVCRAVLDNSSQEDLEKELIQVAAVAVQWVERLRNDPIQKQDTPEEEILDEDMPF